MSLFVVAHPTPGFSGVVIVGGTHLNFLLGWTSPTEVPLSEQAGLEASGFTLNKFPPTSGYLTRAEIDTDPEREEYIPARLSDAALRAALVPFWAATETVTAGTVRMDPTGHTITRNANGTTRASYDSTEQALWTVVSGGGGATLTADPDHAGLYLIGA